MRIKSAFGLLVLVWIVAFLALNWQVISSPARVQFVIGTADTRVGVVIIALGLPVLLALLINFGIGQSALRQENRRQAKDLQVLRALADSAETSRITELGTLFRCEIASLDQRMQAATESLRSELHDTERSIAATLAEMDDRLNSAAAHPDVPAA